MVNICFYFQVHQPERLRNYSVFEIGKANGYFDEKKNDEVMKKVAKKCYLPMNALLLKLIDRHKGKFKVAFSISGTALDQFEKFAPEVLESFKALARTGCVEFLAETYYHSLSFLYNKVEFDRQVEQHSAKIKELFDQTPTVFRNTELIFSNELAMHMQDKGYKAILAEGADHILGWKSPNFLYTSVTAPNIKLLLKNYKLSDDVAFRFSNKGWNEHPLTVDKYSKWINNVNGDGNVVNLFMDYETFGEHQWEDTGIFEFMDHLPDELLKHPDNAFMTPSEVADAFQPVGALDVHNFVSWADLERDVSAWLGNNMQQTAIGELYKLRDAVYATEDNKLIRDWELLTTSDHYYYMCTKWFADGDVHKYFNPYDTPYEGYIAFMNVLNDLTLRIKGGPEETRIQLTEEPSKILVSADQLGGKKRW
ncbi:alpha-amylase [Candidatus Woesearchaeota archaeon]|nr:alpha-amylase [Candidatus Woesearchaeota archaeon]